MGSFFGGTVQPGYRALLHARRHRDMLQAREALSFEQYEAFYNHVDQQDGSDYQNPRNRTGAFRFAGVSGHKRLYETLNAPADHPVEALADGDFVKV